MKKNMVTRETRKKTIYGPVKNNTCWRSEVGKLESEIRQIATEDNFKV